MYQNDGGCLNAREKRNACGSPLPGGGLHSGWMQADLALKTCGSLPGATEGHPFGPGALVFKVAGKMFAIAHDTRLSLKCDPGLAVVLRDTYPAVTAGYHLDKRHWNSIELDGSVPDDVLLDWIQDSYDLVVGSLSRAQRAAISPRG